VAFKATQRPRTDNTRPMPDRVREAIFSILANCSARPCLRRSTLPTSSPAAARWALKPCLAAPPLQLLRARRLALQTLHANIAALTANATRIIRADAWSASLLDEHRRPFDLVFLDPPYATPRIRSCRPGHALPHLPRATACETQIVVLHHRMRRGARLPICHPGQSATVASLAPVRSPSSGARAAIFPMKLPH